MHVTDFQFVQDYPGDELLVVYDPVFKYGQNFYLVLTEEAKERILNVSDQSNLNTGLHVSSCVFFLCFPGCSKHG